MKNDCRRGIHNDDAGQPATNMSSLVDRLTHVDWDFPDSNTAESIASLHPYPAKFIQEIPRRLIDTLQVPSGTWVLDPFCGSGATLVESQLAGYPCIGIDLNPIACLITQVKTRPSPPGLMGQARLIIERALQCQMPPIIPQIPNLDHWFQQSVQQSIARIVEGIGEVEDSSAKDALRLALSSILVRVSNQESDTRYAAVVKPVSGSKVYTLFLSAVERLELLKREYMPKSWEAEVLCLDIMDATPSDIRHPIGLVVTSPPYPNAYEYWLYHKYRMFWLGYDPLNVKRREIGARAHYFRKSPPTEDDFKRQMRHLLRLLRVSVVAGGHVCIVIGRSRIHGRTIDNATLVSEVAVEVGFEPIANMVRQIAQHRKTFNLSHANIKTENILVFAQP